MSDKKKKDRSVLLVWEEPPETASFFLIPATDISENEARILEACHNNLINSSDIDISFTNDTEEVDRALQTLSRMITDPNGSWVSDDWKNSSSEQLNVSRKEFDSILGKWFCFKLDRDKRPRLIPKSKMILSGFIL